LAWEIFEQAASRYEAWYTTERGRHADIAERALLEWLLRQLPNARTVLEVGSGTGHFAARMAECGFQVIGLERAPAMVRGAERNFPSIPFAVGDAQHLPLQEEVVDVAAFITTLEFLDCPVAALREAVRVARRGVVVVALNRWSIGGLSRRFGPQSRASLLGRANDYSLTRLRFALKTAAGARLASMRWSCTLFPNGLWNLRARVPLGDVIGIAAELELSKLDPAKQDSRG
jgi:SAM-dependent methyltransferase